MLQLAGQQGGKMVKKTIQSRMRQLLSEAIMVLCKASLPYTSEFSVEGLLGITMDREEIFLVNINELVQKEGLSLNDATGKNVLQL